MGIFAQPTNQAPSITQVVNTIKIANTNLYRGIIQQHAQIFKTIWSNPNFTPKQTFDAFGTDGVALATLSDELQQMAHNADASYVPLTPPSQYVVTPNEDGSISVTDAIITEQPQV